MIQHHRGGESLIALATFPVRSKVNLKKLGSRQSGAQKLYFFAENGLNFLLPFRD